MNRYAILSSDGNKIENIIIASQEYASGKDMIECDDLDIGVGWVKDENGNFVDPNPYIGEEMFVDEYEEVTLSDEEIANLLRMISEDENRA